MNMTNIQSAASSEGLAAMTIRDLVARYPDTMSVLAPLGIDLCCGGAHQLGEALDLHHLDRDRSLAEIARVVTAAPTR
jgi:iron-sulfur cluster repair protein YtfE (RIC family)